MLDEKELRNNINETKSVIEEVSNSFNNLKKFLTLEDTYQEDIKKAVIKYNKQLIKAIKDPLASFGKSEYDKLSVSFNERNYDKEVIEKVNIYKAYNIGKEKAKKLYETISNIEYSLTDVKPLISNNVLWFFSNKEKKKNAINAYEQIKDLQDKNFASAINQLYTIIEESKNTAEEQFKNDTVSFVDIINDITGNKYYVDYDPPKPDFNQLKRLAQEVDGANKHLARLLDKVRQKRLQITDKAFNLREYETDELLKTIPVDELNRDHRGIKVSALKNAGYNNIYQVSKKSTWELSRVYGVSEDTAYSIQSIVKKIKSSTTGVVKLKLSLDNKNQYATELIKSVAEYIEETKDKKELLDIEKKYYSKSVDAVEFVNTHSGEYEWLKNTFTEKNELVRCKEYIQSALSDNYVGTIKNPLNRRNSNHSFILTNNDIWKYFENNSALVFSVLDDLCPGLFGNSDTFYGLPEELAKEIEEECIFPNGLLVTLRRYQEWGVKYILHQKKVLLGDEMGLGKTVQAIATMVSLKNTGASHFVVVCPASVIINWCREIETHSKLKAIKVHGRGRKTALREWKNNGGVAVTTYETTDYFDLEDDFQYTLLVVDEAHYIKNPEAKRSINVSKLATHAERMLFMTGTALENKVEEMTKLIGDLQPNVAREISNLVHLSQSDLFKQKVVPVYYRRKREDVLTELPELIENKEWCSLNSEEKDIYEQTVLNKNYMQARRLSWNVDNLSKSSKAQRLKELIDEAKEDGRKIIVFSYFLDTIFAIRKFLGDICSQPINGSINPNRRQEIIDEFDKSPAGSVLLAQIQAGGTGLNIQSASVVIITEPQFKPSIENQAISRAYRMGQTRNVLVHRLLCENTIDERLMETLENKQQIFDAFADKSLAAEANKEIDEKTFGNIIEEEIEKIKKEKGLI